MATKELWIDTSSSGTGGLNITDYITDYEVDYPKLWSSDTGRNMKGSNKGTLIGVFTKLVVTTGRARVTPDVATAILQRLNKASVYCKYYDPATQSMKTESFYFGDIATKVLSLKSGQTVINNFSIIANERRV